MMIKSIYIVALITIAFGCHSTVTTKQTNKSGFSNVKEAVNYLIARDSVEDLRVNDTIIRVRDSRNKTVIDLLNKEGKHIGCYILLDHAEKSVGNHSSFDPSNSKIRINKYGHELFQKNCFGCHAPLDIKGNSIPFDSMQVFRNESPGRFEFSKRMYLYVDEENNHWRYFALDSLNRKALQEYLRWY